MGAFWIIRVVCLVLVVKASFVVAGLSAAYLSKVVLSDFPSSLNVGVPPSILFSIVVAGVSLIFTIPMLVIDLIRKGAMTSWVVTELVVFSVLSILWVASAGLSTTEINDYLSDLVQFGLPKTCKGLDELVGALEDLALSDPLVYGEYLNSNLDSVGMLCRSHQATQALAFLNWIILTGYAITLLVSALIAKSRGHPGIWKSTVRGTQFFARREAQTKGQGINVPLQLMQQNEYQYASDQSLKAETQMPVVMMQNTVTTRTYTPTTPEV